MNELLITLDRDSSVPLYVQIYDYIKKEILEGHLSPNASLPSIRKMSEQLRVNKTTLETAYDQLMMEGLIESVPRGGYYIKEIDIGFFHKLDHKYKLNRVEKTESSYQYDFNLDHVDVQHFPLSTWRRLTNEVLSDETFKIFNTGDSQGDLGLREQIANYVRFARGVKCTADQIIIGSHSQILLMLVCNLIGLREKIVAVGEPGYSLATNVFEKYGCHIAPISIERDGMNQIELENSGASIVFTSPSFQFPFGNIMKIQKRISLLKWANSNNAYIIEDDYLSEFRYSGELIPSLQNLDREERVIYLGTFHGSLLPAINIGYLILPPHLLSEYYRSQYEFQQTTSRIEQKTLELFMRNGHWEQHRFRMKEIYKKKYGTIINAIEACFKDKAVVFKGQTGLHIVLEVITSEKEENLLQKARKAGINLYSLSDTWYRQANNPFINPIFLLGFGGLTIEEIENGIAILYRTWF
ncbi:PLP-dependent aminotransferase family protein [Paenibacillus sp. JJ-223]|uniref:MocR-like pyridoxine biosynthesis transcription factor PdxR n=1 Tax=Paenibacillus sp. JJ-223 TaxID=2905647 RepID=UPI001F39E1EA|nr:PLP-dependent aminotransferase family protein [Paenibacillus sp. JJ-223]CAH1197228.1 HTH-type transcriptional regulatory protein GabR [Paenibacillus sp. JJ-223]